MTTERERLRAGVLTGGAGADDFAVGEVEKRSGRLHHWIRMRLRSG